MKKIVTLIIVCISAFAAAQQKPIPAKGLAMTGKEVKFGPLKFNRHAVGDNDVLIEIMYAGICHSDIHTAKGEWGDIQYPIVPGHEIAGKVTQVGKNVTKFKVGDYAGVGCMVNSCGKCEYCKQGLEQYCLEGNIGTYASVDKYHNNEVTQGGYSDKLVITENFAIKIPPTADMKKVAPLLCAGVTTYSPIKHKEVKAGDVVAVAGFGGLGHMAVQYAVKLGAKVTVFDITEDKRADALKMGAVKFVNVTNPEELKGLDNTYKVIISTIPAKYDLNMYLKMLKLDGDLVILGFPAQENLPSINSGQILFGGTRKISGSLIGGIAETQEMLDYSVANNIYPEVEVIKAEPKVIDQAYQNVIDAKVRYRYVIDMKTLK
ncbi:alcohol dehydrogenase catalytic domain-containing protein [Flavobacterium sp. Sd200]|uniref:NAD(P)-dependent alcohol dehydrogenase n=1 Tax=Flavobacterium sp. Sd200 TaxID=2692211 RepID=UPI00136C50F7|nr:NAD(P)-dependent alcohol dehydrogenase [Flavobacterium sp. Sd200]MXN90510.1 alcohol dehydrogenase catalytic domain-containing protein [Flavobacterium sp. Sd200]